MSAEQDLKKPAIQHTGLLKSYLIREYPTDIAFFLSGKYLFVRTIDISTYSIAKLHGCGLRDTDPTKAFG